MQMIGLDSGGVEDAYGCGLGGMGSVLRKWPGLNGAAMFFVPRRRRSPFLNGDYCDKDEASKRVEMKLGPKIVSGLNDTKALRFTDPPVGCAVDGDTVRTFLLCRDA